MQAVPAKCKPQSSIALSANSSTLGQTESATFAFKENEWIFLTVDVPEDVEMHHLKYTIDSMTGAETKLALLVGRCIKEVEGGDCPPRCATITSTDRTPQICQVPRCCYCWWWWWWCG